MLLLLSPAKKLNCNLSLPALTYTKPLFTAAAEQLISILQTKSIDDVCALMSIGRRLAELNMRRYADWRPLFEVDNAYPAVLTFNGDVYKGLNAHKLTAKQLYWAQAHIVILSGLYGALRPLDLIYPYRLEMGTKLENLAGRTLYDFWSNRITKFLNQQQAAVKQPVVLNLASDEYFKAVNRKNLNARVVECVFQENKEGAYKVVSFYAKRARGLMARYAIKHQAENPIQLQDFNTEGYSYDAILSSVDKLVFRRKRI